mmetsp:Transcript_47677/g.103683  ORF Transcript_47677/g.103683 Transcript_47677/m.103683 type:complete len:349 (+) Transcript_47677:44-1090(+)
MSQLLERWLEFERNFDGAPLIAWTRQHAEIPIFVTALYLLFIFTVPEILSKPLGLKTAFAFWNLLLSVFSFLGMTRTVPHLVTALGEHGFRYTVCYDPVQWYSCGPAGLWMALFIFSKIPELMDTVFLVLRKKQVIFLHWFHHVTVLLYCWHAFHTTVAPGLWFASMNYSVHTIMYFYFFMTNVGFYKAMQPLAPFITTIQIIQMVGGIVCLTKVAYEQLYMGEVKTCDVNPANWKLGLAMYLSYFFLFAVLFAQKYYFSPKPRTGTQATGQPSCPPSCPSSFEKTDASGFFHPRSQSGTDLIQSKEDIKAQILALKQRQEQLEKMLSLGNTKAGKEASNGKRPQKED